MKDVIANADKKMGLSIEAFNKDMTKLRTGRANTALLDDVRVDSYGSLMPLSQVATVAAPESRLITVQPWDITQLPAIEKAINNSDLGLNPGNDGKIIRIQIPDLTEERRLELAKIAKKYAEECRVSIRNARREANEALKKLEKSKDITQDDLKKGQDETQKLTDKRITEVEGLLSSKEADIMEL
ncbi:MAG: ribosome recycling factor [Deltaproteobacteria bacterium]|nr:ribosome recycling factor [Deltaproteobacteria bacterium]